MDYRLFGPTGLRVSRLFLGTMTFGEDWGWGAPPEVCREQLAAYLDAGGNVVDTASNYSEGASERILGEVLGSERDRVVLMSKYTITVDRTDANGGGNHRRSLRRSLEQSLRRLRTDHLDLLWVHMWDDETPLEETMRALDDVVRAGQVLYVGISNAPAWVVSRADLMADLRGWTRFAGLQVPYSLVQRDIEHELLPMSETLGLSVAAWSPLAAGLLTGRFTRSGPTGPTRLAADTVPERDLSIARVADAVADELGVSTAQVALAWTFARRPDLHPIIGARRLDQLADAFASVDVRLRDDQLDRLDAAGAPGRRYPYDFLTDNRDYVLGSRGSHARR